MGDKDRMTAAEIDAEEGMADWRPVLHRLVSRFATGDFVTGLGFVTKVTDAAEAANHHPDVDLRYPHVDVTLMSHDVSGLTQRDVRLARQISEIARELGIEGDPSSRSLHELAIDTWDADQIGPFWAAVLGGDYEDEQVRSDPALWFQETEQHDEPRQRFHWDVWVPVDQAQPRIDAALAAGGTLVSDESAPSYWVLADAQGNKACICTSAARG